MRKKTSVAFLALLGLLLFGCSKKTTKDNTTTKTPTPVTTTAKPTATKEQVKKFTVSVVNSIQNAGTISGTGEIEEGKSTTLKATANTGYMFLGFYDGETLLTDQSEYTISNITKNITITAKWTALQSTLEIKTFSNVDPTAPVEFDDNSLGTVAFISEQKEKYATGEEITLKATPEEGYQFNGWYLVTSEGDHPISETDYLNEEITFKMYGAASTIKAVFGTKKCTIEIVANMPEAMEHSYIYSYDEDYDYMDTTTTFDYDQQFDVYVDVYDGYSLIGFYLLDENGEYDPDDMIDDSCVTWYAHEDYKFIAVFKANTYDLFVIENVKDAGIYTGVYKEENYDEDMIDGGFSVEFASSITLTATAAEGYTFAGYYSDEGFANLLSADPTYTYTVTVADDNFIYIKYAANDVQVNFSVDSVDGEGNPLGTINVESGKYAYNSTIRITATPNEGYKFDGWYIKTWNTETEEYDYELYTDGWDDEFNVETTEEISIAAKFSVASYYVYLGTNIENVDLYDGILDAILAANPGIDSNSFEYGSTITVTAPTVTGYTFLGWYYDGDCVYDGETITNIDSITAWSETAECTFTMWAGDLDCLIAAYSRNTYSVRYNKEVGMTVAHNGANLKYGLNYTLDVPELDQHVFKYWYTEDADFNEVKLTNSLGQSLAPWTLILDSTLTIYASFEKDKVAVTFDTCGGSDVDEQFITIGHNPERPADDPEKDGYTFVNWYTEAEGGILYNFSSPISTSVTIYAQWVINQYEITLESQDDSVLTVNSDKIDNVYDYHTELELVANILDNGYYFVGWFEGETLISDQATYTYTLPSHNVTLVAKYEAREYKVQFYVCWWADNVNYNWLDISNIKLYLNGELFGTGYVTGEATYVYLKYNSEFTLTVELDPARPYLYVMDWYGTITGSYTGTNQNELTYTNTVPARSFYMRPEIGSYKKQLEVSKSTNTGTEGSNPYFTAKGITGNQTKTDVKAECPVKLYATEIDGYTFAGWYIKGTDNLISEELEYEFNMPYQNLQYEARYNNNEYTLTANKYVDDHVDPTTDNILNDNVEYHDSYTVSTDSMTGYTFLGWFVPGTDTPVSTDFAYEIEMPKNDVILEARFEINTYEIYFQYGISNTDWNLDAGEVDGYYSNIYYYGDYNTTMAFEATVNEGWTFKGYYYYLGDVDYDRSEFASYTLLSNDASYEYTIDDYDYTVTIFAIFEARSFNAVYNKNGGTCSANGKSILMGDEFTLDVPTQSGKTFFRWEYTDLDLVTTYLTDDEGNGLLYWPFAENIRVEAVWGTEIETVTFDTGYDAATAYTTDTQSFTIKVEHNTTVGVPTDPVRRGYIFDGWFTEEEGGDAWVFTTNVVTSNITLYAHWTVLTFHVKLDCGASNQGEYTYVIQGTSISGTVNAYHSSTDTSITTITIEYGQTLILTPTTFNLGRKFNVWTIYTYSGSYYSTSTTNSFKYTYLDDMWFRMSITYKPEMQYYTFTSTSTTCTITGLSSSGKSATNLVVPNYVTEINSGAFAGNTVLQSITLPFTGQSKEATGANRLFGYIFGTSNATGYTAVIQKYLNGTTETTAPTRCIPSTLHNVTITDEIEIADYAFHNMELITSFTIDCDIERIGKHALEYLKVSTLDLPASLKTLDVNSLRYMTNLKKLVIPNDNMEYIAKGTLYNNSQLQELTIPFIGSSYDATGAEALFGWIFGESTTSNASYYVAKQIYTIDASITDSNSVSYQMPVNLKKVTVNYNTSKYSYANVEWGAFSACSKITDISINVKSRGRYNSSSSYTSGRINANAFRDCSSLVNIDGVFFTDALVIYNYAFYNTALTEFTSRCYDYYNYSFANCHALTSVTITGNISANTLYFETGCFMNCENLEDLVIEQSASTTNRVYVYASAFYGCSKLKSFEVERYLEFIGDNAFNGCSSLSTFNVLGFANVITNNAFKGCSSLVSLEISWKDGTAAANKKINDNAFANCSSLKTLTIASDCTYFGATILTGCAALTTLSVPFIGKDANVTAADSISTTSNANTADANYILGYFFGKTSYNGAVAKTMHETNTTTATYYIPKLTTLTLTNVNNCIPAYACENFASLYTVKVTGKQSSTYDIGTRAFVGTYVHTVSFADGARKFYPRAFYNLYIDHKLVLPDTVNYVGELAFASNYIIGELVLPNTNISVSVEAFYNNRISKLVVNSFNQIRSNAFASNGYLTSVEFNYGTTSSSFGSIEGEAFLGCTNTSLVVHYYGTKDQFTAIISGGKLATNWNLVSAASGSTAAKYFNTISCSDGLLNI